MLYQPPSSSRQTVRGENTPMIALQPAATGAASQWLILIEPLSMSGTAFDVVSSVGLLLRAVADPLHLSVDAQGASFVPVQSSADLSTLIADLKDAIKIPGWVGTLLKWSGLITMIIGIIAYFVSPSLNNRRRGFMMATTGVVVSIIGFAFPVFIRLIDYVLSG